MSFFAKFLIAGCILAIIHMYTAVNNDDCNISLRSWITSKFSDKSIGYFKLCQDFVELFYCSILLSYVLQFLL